MFEKIMGSQISKTVIAFSEQLNGPAPKSIGSKGLVYLFTNIVNSSMLNLRQFRLSIPTQLKYILKFLFAEM